MNNIHLLFSLSLCFNIYPFFIALFMRSISVVSVVHAYIEIKIHTASYFHLWYAIIKWHMVILAQFSKFSTETWFSIFFSTRF